MFFATKCEAVVVVELSLRNSLAGRIRAKRPQPPVPATGAN